MKRQTATAIQNRLSKGETRFHIGAYYYECNVNGMIRRREQRPGYLPTSEWEWVCNWSPSAWAVEA